MLEGIRKHPLLEKVLARGEERAGRWTAKLLSNERVAAAFQAVLESARQARRRAERGVRWAAQTWRPARAGDLDELRRKVSELERTLDELSARVDRSRGANRTQKQT